MLNNMLSQCRDKSGEMHPGINPFDEYDGVNHIWGVFRHDDLVSYHFSETEAESAYRKQCDLAREGTPDRASRYGSEAVSYRCISDEFTNTAILELNGIED